MWGAVKTFGEIFNYFENNIRLVTVKAYTESFSDQRISSRNLVGTITSATIKLQIKYKIYLSVFLALECFVNYDA